MDHPVFNNMKFDHLWEARLSSQIFEGEYKLVVWAAKDTGPTQEQKELFAQFIAMENKLKTSVLRSILDYYSNIRPEAIMSLELDENNDEDADEIEIFVPDIKDPKEIMTIIEPQAIIIPDQNGHLKGKMGLLYHCSWEDEHGLGVLIDIINHKVEKVGYQEICF